MFSNRIRRNHRRGSVSAMVLIAAAALFVVGSTSAYAMGTDGGSTTNPWVQSDQADYAPGSTVTLTGGNWQPGESVHIFVDDSNGHTWNHSADVTADDMGTIQDVFNLPNSFVSNYDVTATGVSSGTAATSFTDASLTVIPGAAGAGVTFTVQFQGFSDAACSTGAGTSRSQPISSDTGSALTPLGSFSFIKLTAPSTPTTPAGASFTNWTSPTSGTFGTKTTVSVCVPAPTGSNNDQYRATYAATKTDQTISFAALADKTFGDAAFTVSASGGGSGNPVTFTAVGNCTSGGTNGATITITGAGSCTVTANQAGNANYNAATAVPQTFSIAKASQTITFGALGARRLGMPRSRSARVVAVRGTR